jgi:hypothetical protein
MANIILTVERLKELMKYDPDTGEFTRLVQAGPKALAGSIAGSMYNNGYRVICICGKDYGVHRLAWFYTYGVWPKHNIDHINGARDDNRIINLRDVTQSVNMQNLKTIHADKVSCKLIGATWDKMWGNWKAQLTLNKKTIYIGRYKTAEEAHAAYLKAKRKLHQGCTI